MERFSAIAEGYLGGTGDWLDDAESASLALSARVITFECGIRFLVDFLDGDRYFKIAYPDHNRVRCRAQFALLKDMEARSDDMEASVRRAVRTGQAPGG